MSLWVKIDKIVDEKKVFHLSRRRPLRCQKLSFSSNPATISVEGGGGVKSFPLVILLQAVHLKVEGEEGGEGGVKCQRKSFPLLLHGGDWFGGRTSFHSWTTLSGGWGPEFKTIFFNANRTEKPSFAKEEERRIGPKGDWKRWFPELVTISRKSFHCLYLCHCSFCWLCLLISSITL